MNLSSLLKKLGSEQDLGAVLTRALRETVFIVYVAVSLLLLLSLLTFDAGDPGWSHAAEGALDTRNAAGPFGAWLSDLFLSLLGICAYLMPLLLSAYGYAIFRNADKPAPSPADTAFRALGLMVALAAATAIAERFMVRPRISLPSGIGYGGELGRALSDLLAQGFGGTGMTIVLIALLLSGISLCTRLSWLTVLDDAGKVGFYLFEQGARLFAYAKSSLAHAGSLSDIKPVSDATPVSIKPSRDDDTKPARPAFLQRKPAEQDEPVKTNDTPPARPAPASDPVVAKPRKSGKPLEMPPVQLGQLPTLELLGDRAPRVRGYSGVQLEEMSRQLETILDDFGVDVQVTEVHPGPVVTRFEVQPAPGVKVSRISSLAKDLARTLSVTSVRVVEIIPGKTVIGLEIPNEEREMVLLHSVLSSDAYQGSHSPLTLVLGKDIGGNPVVANLARMPHLLVAGTTGSGKSVAVNVMILSMLFKARPEEVRMIMIDPKMLELSIYEGIPHLLTPVVTDMKEAANALRWCVAEMERRYKLMSLMGVRNVNGFNQKITEAVENGEPIRDPLWDPDLRTEHDEAPFLEPLPYVVIVIDELADMMMIVGKKVEELIARLAQKARAAGLHLILATQRPSVDVITGLIKANIPTRIGFQVSSKIDSRTILDQGGAESLLGNGDMLYLPPGTGLPMRAHGAFVSDDEVHHVVEFLKRTGPTNYINEITRFSEDGGDFSGFKGASGDEGDESDPLYDEAVRFVTESRKASISSVQRRLKVGYNRAARMIEDMERAGIVGPAETNGSRSVLAPPPVGD